MSTESGYIHTFQRYEIKYLLTEKQFHKLNNASAGKFVPDEYGKSRISNIYLDTPDFRLIRESIEKPIYKEKLRIRSYKTPAQDDIVFIELKKKYKGIVYKRRIEATLAEAEAYLYEGKPLPVSTQISREIDYVLDFYPDVKPSAGLFYDREAFFAADDPTTRITFDSNVVSRLDNLHLSQGTWGEALIDSDLYLMELKITNAVPLWLARVLDKYEIYPTSFSKYGRAYQRSEQSKLNDVVNQIIGRKNIYA